jgi:rhodanese-related sulfurtransferase
MEDGVAKLIDRDTVVEKAAQGAQLVEVLPAREYAEDHLPGAVSHPLGRLDVAADQIDRNRPVIVYCWDAA